MESNKLQSIRPILTYIFYRVSNKVAFILTVTMFRYFFEQMETGSPIGNRLQFESGWTLSAIEINQFCLCSRIG